MSSSGDRQSVCPDVSGRWAYFFLCSPFEVFECEILVFEDILSKAVGEILIEGDFNSFYFILFILFIFFISEHGKLRDPSESL